MDVSTTGLNRVLVGFYVVMAITALVATGWHNVSYFAAPGETDLAGYIAAALANSASTALALDVTFVGVVCQVFMVAEGRRVGLSWTLLVALLVGTAAVAIAVTFPVFLVARSLAVGRRGAGAHVRHRSR